MKIPVGAVCALASQRRLSLQVPHIGFNSGFQDIPDSWVCWLNNYRIVSGREQGYLFLTRKGYNANRDRLRQAFESSIQVKIDDTWADFERAAEEHFAKVEKAYQKLLQRKRKELAELERFVV